MTCDPFLLLRLLRGEASAEEVAETLRHLEMCAACRERIRTMAVLEAAAAPDEDAAEMVRKARRRRWPLAAAVLLLLTGSGLYWHSFRPPDTSRLATQEAYPAFPLEVRSPSSDLQASLRREALAAYGRQEYEQALALFRQLAPDGESQFLSGVCLYFLGKLDPALEAFRAAFRDDRWKPAAQWYTASILLRKQRVAEARRILEILGRSDPEFGPRARDLVRQLDALEQ